MSNFRVEFIPLLSERQNRYSLHFRGLSSLLMNPSSRWGRIFDSTWLDLNRLALRLSWQFHNSKAFFGKISAQPHTTLCIQFLDRENNDKNNRLPLGKQICFTIVWGCAEILPFFSMLREKLECFDCDSLKFFTKLTTKSTLLDLEVLLFNFLLQTVLISRCSA